MIKSINITIYCDEIKKAKSYDELNKTNEIWDYIGILIVPTKNIALLSNELNMKRCPNSYNHNCLKKCEYHEDNKIKIHYQDYTTTKVYQTADRWCDTIINNNVKTKLFYTHILGINRNKIDRHFFCKNNGYTNVDNNIYNRFFRTALKYPLKSFFSKYDVIIVDNIFHDCGPMDNHQYFKKQPLDKLKNDIPNIHFNCNEIKSIQTTNQNCLEEDNVLLQFIDLILGGTMNCLHYTGKKNKEKIALKLVNVIKESLKPSWNSKYRKVYNISFFPKHKLDENDGKIEKEKKYNENYYKNRELKILNRNQISMFEFLDQ